MCRVHNTEYRSRGKHSGCLRCEARPRFRQGCPSVLEVWLKRMQLTGEARMGRGRAVGGGRVWLSCTGVRITQPRQHELQGGADSEHIHIAAGIGEDTHSPALFLGVTADDRASSVEPSTHAYSRSKAVPAKQPYRYPILARPAAATLALALAVWRFWGRACASRSSACNPPDLPNTYTSTSRNPLGVCACPRRRRPSISTAATLARPPSPSSMCAQ